MTGAYLAVLLASCAGVGALDARWRLVLGERGSRGRALGVVVAGAVLLLGWDLVAIRAGFYGRGASDALLGVEVAPNLPVEELVFVVFLPYVTLVVAAAWRRTLARRPSRRDEP